MSAPGLPLPSSRRRLAGSLLLCGLAIQVLLLAMSAVQGDLVQVLLGMIMVAALLYVSAALWRRALSVEQVMQRLTLLLLSRTLIDLGQDLYLRVTPGLLFFLEFQVLVLLLFSSLPIRWTLRILGVLYALLLGVSFAGGTPAPNVTALLMLPIMIGATGFTALYGRQMVEERLRSAALEAQLARDALTGTLSRREMEERLDALRGQSDAGRHLLLVMDVDHFKSVNDRFGHHIGDQVLQQVGAALHAGIRSDDLVGRWGGEEFVVLLRDVSHQQASELVERLLRCVRSLKLAEVPHLTVSAGGAWLSEAPTMARTLQLADRRMYAAKAAGRDRFCLSGFAERAEPPREAVTA